MAEYILNEDQFKAMQALRDFATSAFGGYFEDHGREEEIELADTFHFLVRDYIDLVEATIETLDEYEDRHAEYKAIFKH